VVKAQPQYIEQAIIVGFSLAGYINLIYPVFITAGKVINLIQQANLGFMSAALSPAAPSARYPPESCPERPRCAQDATSGLIGNAREAAPRNDRGRFELLSGASGK
jgi:hypothetical protein